MAPQKQEITDFAIVGPRGQKEAMPPAFEQRIATGKRSARAT
jgi:hypothetical protein